MKPATDEAAANWEAIAEDWAADRDYLREYLRAPAMIIFDCLKAADR